MSVNPSTLSEGPAAAPKEKEEKKSGFRPFSSIREGIRGRRARGMILRLLDDAIHFDEKEPFDDAMKAFSSLDAKGKEKVMLQAQERLKSCSYSPFETEEKTRALMVLADFFAEAAKSLPVDGNGERMTGSYPRAIKTFTEAVERTSFRSNGNGAHAAAVLSCAKALWELEYGRFSFWEERALEPATRDYVVKQLLDMKPTENFEEHGWYLLRKNIKQLAIAVAESDSENKEKFLFAMLLDEDTEVVKEALRGAIHLEPVPPQLIWKADEISSVEGLAAEAKGFVAAANFKNLLTAEGEQKYFAARQLANLYTRGMPHLRPELEKMGKAMVAAAISEKSKEDEKIKSIAVVTGLTSIGIMPYSSEELRSMLSPLVSSPANAALLYELTGRILNGKEREDLRRAALELEAARIEACKTEFSYADNRQFDAADEFVFLFQSGRMPSRLDLMHVAMDLAEVALEPSGEKPEERAEQKKKAESLLQDLVSFGINLRADAKELEILSESIETLFAAEDRRIINLLDAVDSQNPNMLKSRLMLVQLGLDMAIMAAESPGEQTPEKASERKAAMAALALLKAAAVDIKADAIEAKRIKELWTALDPSDERVFQASSELIGLYKAGKADRGHMISIGISMARVLAEQVPIAPQAEAGADEGAAAVDTEASGAAREVQERKQKAESVLAALRDAGIQINVNIKTEQSEKDDEKRGDEE